MIIVTKVLPKRLKISIISLKKSFFYISRELVEEA